MDNRKHMRTEKKTAVKNSFGRLLATGIDRKSTRLNSSH